MEEKKKRVTEYRVAGVTILVHVLALIACFYVLMVVFEFPDILRMSAEYRLSLFLENSSIIVPTYYVFALTGISQIILSIFLHQILDDNKATVVVLATVFGVLTGLFQVLGFIRWPILIPYIADAMANANSSGVSQEMVAFVEGAFNRYAGMAIGEHLGFFAQAGWTTLIGAAMLGRKLFDRRLGWAGLVIGILTFPMSMEPLGLDAFSVLTVPVNAAWDIWLIFLAISLFRTDAATETGPKFGWKSLLAATVVWLLNVVPAFVG